MAVYPDETAVAADVHAAQGEVLFFCDADLLLPKAALDTAVSL